jgi:nucleoside-diphosphate-sugar epimerase
MVLGTGWLGSEIVRQADAGREVIALEPLLEADLATFDRPAAASMAARIDASGTTTVINACGLTSGTFEQLDQANVAFPSWLCELLRGSGVRLVHLGSAAEYGDPSTGRPVPESTACAPIGDYATTKARGSDVVLASRSCGLDATVARVFNVVDRTMPASSPVRQWLDALGELGSVGGEIEVWWPPTRRDFSTRADVARALLDLARATTHPEVVNVCSGVGLAYGDIVAALAEALGVAAKVRSLDRPGIEDVVGDPTLLDEVIGWVPAMSVELLVDTVAP